jgi:hypothetical protein
MRPRKSSACDGTFDLSHNKHNRKNLPMATLTETRIEIADRHTTLCHFTAGKKTKRVMMLGNSDGYNGLYDKAAVAKGDAKDEANGLDYASQFSSAGKILAKLLPIYKNTKYWKRYLNCDPFTANIWRAALPLHATISERIEVTPPAGFTAKIRPAPSVLIYPFGWSTWVSIRITGEHTLEQLAALEEHLFTQKCIQVGSAGTPVALQSFLDHVGEGIRADAFCNAETRDAGGTNKAVVITVLEKHGGSLSLGALDDNAQNMLKRMVRPEGAPSRRSFDQLVFHVDAGSDLNYMVIDELGRFIWMERLLSPEDRNHQWLNCYHHNSFISLVQAWHFEGLLTEGGNLKLKPKPLEELLAAAKKGLTSPTFTNASLKGFLELSKVKSLLESLNQKPKSQ